jgi:hypothetical protein
LKQKLYNDALVSQFGQRCHHREQRFWPRAFVCKQDPRQPGSAAEKICKENARSRYDNICLLLSAEDASEGGQDVDRGRHHVLDKLFPRSRSANNRGKFKNILMQHIHFSTPLHPFQFIVNNTMTTDSKAHEQVNHILMYAGIITHCMCYFNSAINPIIYYFMSAQFKVTNF